MDKREQRSRAWRRRRKTKMLLAKIYERMTNAAARNIPAATGFCSREQMPLPNRCAAGDLVLRRTATG